MRVEDTARTKNLAVAVAKAVSLGEMEAVLGEVASGHGLYFSHVTTLGQKRYPGNRHWHLKQDPKTRGCLDVTYWPSGPLMWISMRRSEPSWVHEEGRRLQHALEAQLDRLGPA
jgi:hypothetical protein